MYTGVRWQGHKPSGNKPLPPGARSPKKRAKEGVNPGSRGGKRGKK